MDDISELIKTHGIDHVIDLYGITARDWDRAIDSDHREIGGFPTHDVHAQNAAIVSRVLAQRNNPPKGYKPDGPTGGVVPPNLSKRQFGVDARELMRNDLAESTIANRNRRPRHGS